MTRRLHDIGAVVRALAGQAEALARELLPGGRRQRSEWVCGDLAGNPGHGVSVCLHGPKAGVWKDFQGGTKGGDALDLVAVCRFGGDKSEALRWALGWLGWGQAGSQAFVAPAPRPQQPVRELDDNRAKAKALWLNARLLAGSPAAAYLEGRGVGPEQLGRAPGALRFTPDAWCQERGIRAPAMLAQVQREGKTIACHRTFLAPKPGGGWGKAPIRCAKKTLGPIAGGFIPLWRGASGRPMAEAPDDDVLAVTEGIEDGLTVALHQPQWRVIAALNIGNMAALRLPERFADIVLCFDRDGENPQSRRARIAAVDALLAQGRSVREATPPEGFKDFNAWHLHELQQPHRMEARPA